MNESDRPTKIVRQLRGGQMTIPADFRRELGIEENTMLQITLSEGELRVRPVEVSERPRGSSWLKELYDEFAPARQEIVDRGYSEDEVNSMIDDAVAATRRKS